MRHDEIIPIPLDPATFTRLCALARACGAHPIDIAASLLHDVLKDNDEAHKSVTIGLRPN